MSTLFQELRVSRMNLKSGPRDLRDILRPCRQIVDRQRAGLIELLPFDTPVEDRAERDVLLLHILATRWTVSRLTQAQRELA